MKAVGLDIASTGVRVAVLTPRADKDGQYVVERMAFVKYADGRKGFRGYEPESITEIDEAVRTALKRVGAGRRGMTIGYRGRVAVTTVDLPASFAKTSHKDQESVLRGLKLDIYRTVNADSARLSWRVVREFEDKSSSGKATRKVRVEVAAVERDDIQPLELIISALGLEPARIDSIQAANVRALLPKSLEDPEAGQSYVMAVCDFGAQQTSITVIRDSTEILYTHSTDRGGDHLTDTIAPYLQGASKDPEAVKRTLSATTGRLDLSAQGTSDVSNVKTAIDNYAFQIHEALRSYSNSNAGASDVDWIFLTGGGARLTDFAELVKQSTGVEYVYLAGPLVSKLGRQAQDDLRRIMEENAIDTNNHVEQRRVLMDFTTAIGLAIPVSSDIRGDRT